jgi:predicted Zn-dependent protease
MSSLENILEALPLKVVLGLDRDQLEATRQLAYNFYLGGQFTDAEVLCRGLIAADHEDTWAYSLYAAVLRRQGRLVEALATLDAGLGHDAANPKLTAMRAETAEALAFIKDAVAARKNAGSAPVSTAATVAASQGVRS